jgi:dCMP deaminase
MNWTEYFREIATVVAKKSKDVKTHIGAVIVGIDNEIVSTGYNSYPRGLNDNLPERQERPEKYHWFEHAERNAIYNAARIGVSTKGCSLYLSHWFPCVECTRAIIQSGITTLYCDPLDEKASNSNYNESFKRSLQMLREAGVQLRYYENIV